MYRRADPPTGKASVSDTTRRPLPLLTLDNEFFWTSGADGTLRFQRCDSCDAFAHPPAPVCRYCHGDRLTVVPVSGKATLVGFTVSYGFHCPGLSSPYVVAQVAIAEDPRVRLTTNAVECDPDELWLGRGMEVVFAGIEDVWLPLFRPAVDSIEYPAPLPEDDAAVAITPHVRVPFREDKFEDRVVISGIGMSPIGRRLMVSPLSLTIQASHAAITDAGLGLADIDGVASYPGFGDVGGYGEGGVSSVISALGIRPTWHNGGVETFGPVGSVIAAMLAVSCGLARHVLCFRTVWQATHTELIRRGKIRIPTRRSGDWGTPFGAISAAHTVAQTAQRYMARYGATRETLGWIALNQRANAMVNPTAIYRDPLTMDDYLNARPITTPFGLFDCDVPCDGSVAVVVSAVETAPDLAQRPIRVEAVGTQIIDRLDWDQGTMTHVPQVLGQAAHMWSRTSLRPDDVDVAELYDGFTFNCLSWMEALGFCGIGEAAEFLDGGRAIARDGVLPVNTHGGQLSHGRTHGMGLVHEAVSQLRGQAGARQIAGARVGVVSSGGLTPSGVLLLRGDG